MANIPGHAFINIKFLWIFSTLRNRTIFVLQLLSEMLFVAIMQFIKNVLFRTACYILPDFKNRHLEHTKIQDNLWITIPHTQHISIIVKSCRISTSRLNKQTNKC